MTLHILLLNVNSFVSTIIPTNLCFWNLQLSSTWNTSPKCLSNDVYVFLVLTEIMDTIAKWKWAEWLYFFKLWEISLEITVALVVPYPWKVILLDRDYISSFQSKYLMKESTYFRNSDRAPLVSTIQELFPKMRLD